jgi:vacuolar-type H+-ATPase subunit E/Vma4
MARGWESKSVEAQQADADEQTKEPRARLTAKEATLMRQREGLRLARQRVLQQIEVSSNPHHRRLLDDTLADLDRKLKQLGE